MKILSIEVEGMSCGGCVKKISNHFQAVDKVKEIEVSLDKSLVVISGEDALSSIEVRNELNELGFNVKSIRKA